MCTSWQSIFLAQFPHTYIFHFIIIMTNIQQKKNVNEKAAKLGNHLCFSSHWHFPDCLLYALSDTLSEEIKVSVTSAWVSLIAFIFFFFYFSSFVQCSFTKTNAALFLTGTFDRTEWAFSLNFIVWILLKYILYAVFFSCVKRLFKFDWNFQSPVAYFGEM